MGGGSGERQAIAISRTTDSTERQDFLFGTFRLPQRTGQQQQQHVSGALTVNGTFRAAARFVARSNARGHAPRKGKWTLCSSRR